MALPPSELSPADDHDDPARAALLDLVARRVVEVGYNAVSIRQLAREGGVSMHKVYRDFGTKAGLLAEAINRSSMAEMSRLRSTIGTAASVARVWERHRERAGLRALLIDGAVAARRDPVVRQALREDHRQRAAKWVETYRRWQGEGDFAPDVDMEALVTVLWSCELGMGILESFGIEIGEPEQVAEIIGRLLATLGDDPTGS